MIRGKLADGGGAELASPQEAIECCAECCPKHVLVLGRDRGGVMESLFELAEEADGNRKP